MRRADIAQISAVTGGADYLSTVLFSSDGPASDSGHRFASAEAEPLSHHSHRERISRYRVTSHRLATDFPRCCPRSISRSCGVHRYKPVREWRFRHLTPFVVEVPNDAVAVNAWAS